MVPNSLFQVFSDGWPQFWIHLPPIPTTHCSLQVCYAQHQWDAVDWLGYPSLLHPALTPMDALWSPLNPPRTHFLCYTHLTVTSFVYTSVSPVRLCVRVGRDSVLFVSLLCISHRMWHTEENNCVCNWLTRRQRFHFPSLSLASLPQILSPHLPHCLCTYFVDYGCCYFSWPTPLPFDLTAKALVIY